MEDIDGVEDAANKCAQYREQNVVVTNSDDEGSTWSGLREISQMVQTHGAVMVVG